MVLKVENLSVTYAQKTAVNRISFQVKSGQVIGLLGANGAGKSSTIAAVLGIEKSTHDEPVIMNKSTLRNRKEIFEQVGVQFQETHSQDELTVSDACDQWKSLYKKTADESTLLQTFGLAGKEKQLVKLLSGGEGQRLAVLLAIIHEPKIVFLVTTGPWPGSGEGP